MQLGITLLTHEEQQQRQGPPYVDLSTTDLDPNSPEAADYIGDHIGEQLHLRGIACDG